VIVKQTVARLLRKLGLRLDAFSAVSPLTPERVIGNADFVVQPVYLRRMVRPAEADRIIAGNEHALTALFERLVAAPTTDLRAALSRAALQVIDFEVDPMARTISSTAIELLMKDNAEASERMWEEASVLVRQLAAGYTLFSAGARVARAIGAQVSDEELLTRNYDWIISLLRDVVEGRAMLAVRDAFDQPRPKPAIPRRSSHRFEANPGVYVELGELRLSHQPYPSMLGEIGRDAARVEGLDAFLSLVGNEPDDDLPSRFPSLVLEQAEQARAAVKGLLRAVLKNAGPERGFGVALALLRRQLPAESVEDVQPLVTAWVRTAVRSPLLVRQLLASGYITLAQLQTLNVELLSGDPFNLRNASFVIHFAHFALVTEACLEPKDLVETLRALVMLDPHVVQSSDVLRVELLELTALFWELRAPPSRTWAAPGSKQPFEALAGAVGADPRAAYAELRAQVETGELVALLRKLHQLRPLANPGFAFAWMQLVSDAHLLARVFSSKAAIPVFAVLLADWAALLGCLGADARAFRVAHRAFARLLLVAKRDCPVLLGSSLNGVLLNLLPFRLVALRGFLLSLEATGEPGLSHRSLPAISGSRYAIMPVVEAVEAHPAAAHGFIAGRPASAMLVDVLVSASVPARMAVLEALIDRVRGPDAEFFARVAGDVVASASAKQPGQVVPLGEALARVVFQRLATAGPRPNALRLAAEAAFKEGSPAWLALGGREALRRIVRKVLP
jgi:hypothetical protein